jgi:hypothetical protein
VSQAGGIGLFAERGTAPAPWAMRVVEMRGAWTEARDTRATELAASGHRRMWRGRPEV